MLLNYLQKQVSAMKRFLIILSLLAFNAVLFSNEVMAQPQKSRVQTTQSQKKNGSTARPGAGNKGQTPSVSRASLMFPTAVDVPETPAWRRDIYRTLDLTKDENAALYFPVEPQGDRLNLFCLIFKLLNEGKLAAYEYKLDGVEDFDQKNRMHFKDMLERYHIFYEGEGKNIKVEQSDIPSGEVLSFNVKESSYFDQYTATYHSRITALCPVLHRSDDFSMDIRKYPMFWIKYEDLEKHLSTRMVMTSNLNNAALMSMDDFFATNHYKGEIYMTTNMQSKPLAQYCPTDSLLKKEQDRIEKQMTDFEKNIWATPVDSAEIARRDSIAAAQSKGRKSAKKSTSTSSASDRRAEAKSKKEKEPKQAGQAGDKPRVSVRRQRH